MEKAIIEVRPAVLSDIDGIMEVERASFGEEVSLDAMASYDMMRHRVSLVNQSNPKWFWVSIYRGEIVGYIIMQPTNLAPEDCVSWSSATDGGMLNKTFQPDGSNIYGVSGGAKDGVPGAFEMLLHRLLIVWIESGKRYFMLCSRMPGYEKANRTKSIRPEDYWQRRRSGKPFDPMLRMYYESLGVEPFKFLRDGYDVDKKSGGHGVLCVSENPTRTLGYLADKIYRAGFALARREKE